QTPAIRASLLTREETRKNKVPSFLNSVIAKLKAGADPNPSTRKCFPEVKPTPLAAKNEPSQVSGVGVDFTPPSQFLFSLLDTLRHSNKTAYSTIRVAVDVLILLPRPTSEEIKIRVSDKI
ncbi:hypothetical protein LTR66_016199, partial [Elasticomyces elasticus]